MVQDSEKIVEFHFIDTKKTTFYRQGFRALKMLRIIESSHGGGWSSADCEATTGSMWEDSAPS